MLTDDQLFDSEAAAALLESAFYADTGTDVLEACPDAVSRAEQDGFKPLLRLSRGPVSEVWRCVDRGSMMDVVIKTIRPGAMVSPEEAQSWLRQEAQVLGRLKGTGSIMPLRQTSDGWSSYLALPYINGEPITTHCRLHRLDLGQRLRLFARCVDCIAQVHERGVVHGDLKPEHLLIDSEAGDAPAVIDFGLATQREHTSAAVSGRFNIGGTAAYTAPEIARPDCRPDPRQDVYSLGVVLSELVQDVGAGNDQDKLAQVIQVAAAASPDARYRTARDLHQALSPVLSSTRRPEADTLNGSLATQPGRIGGWGSPIYGVGLLCTAIVIALVLAGGIDPIRGGTADDESGGKQAEAHGSQSDTASMFPGLIAEALGDPIEVRSTLAELDPAELECWEVGHAARVAAGIANEFPFGEAPYQGPFAVVSCYDPRTQTLAWANHMGEVWTRSSTQSPEVLWRAQPGVLVKRLQFRPDGDELLVVDSAGHFHLIPTEPAGESESQVFRTGLAAPMVAGYSESGASVMTWRSQHSIFEAWGPDAERGADVSRQRLALDFACMSARPGYLGFSRGLDEDGREPVRFEVMDALGQLVCKVDLPIAGRVTAFDFHPELHRLWVGLSNGHILCFDVSDRSVCWSTYLGFSAPVAAVLAVPDERRVFASMGSIHLLGLESGTHIDQLGNPEEQAVGVASLYWSAEERSLTACSPVAVRRWRAD